MMNVRHVSEDILKLYARFGYEEFVRSEVNEKEMYYSLKKLTNDAVILKVGKNKDNVLKYKLSKYVVDKCKKYEEKG